MLGPGCENYLGFHFGDRFQMMIHVFSLFIISYSDSICFLLMFMKRILLGSIFQHKLYKLHRMFEKFFGLVL